MTTVSDESSFPAKIKSSLRKLEAKERIRRWPKTWEGKKVDKICCNVVIISSKCSDLVYSGQTPGTSEPGPVDQWVDPEVYDCCLSSFNVNKWFLDSQIRKWIWLLWSLWSTFGRNCKSGSEMTCYFLHVVASLIEPGHRDTRKGRPQTSGSPDCPWTKTPDLSTNLNPWFWKTVNPYFRT